MLRVKRSSVIYQKGTPDLSSFLDKVGDFKNAQHMQTKWKLLKQDLEKDVEDGSASRDGAVAIGKMLKF